MPIEKDDLDLAIDRIISAEQAKLEEYKRRLEEIRQLSANVTDEEIDILKQMHDVAYGRPGRYKDLWNAVNRKASQKQIAALMQGMGWNEDDNFWPTITQCCDANELSDVIIAQNIIFAAAKVYSLEPSTPGQNLLLFYKEILQKSKYAKPGQQMYVNTSDAITLIFEALYSRLQADMEKGENLQAIETSELIHFIKDKIRLYRGVIERGELPGLKSACRKLIELVHRIQSMNLASEQAQDREFLGALYDEPNKSQTISMDRPRDI